MMDRKKLLLLYNPSAGRAQTSRNLDMLLQKFCTGGCETTVYPILDGLNAEDILAGAESAGYDIVVCCGGDGTLHEVVNGLFIQQEVCPDGERPAAPGAAASAGLYSKRQHQRFRRLSRPAQNARGRGGRRGQWPAACHRRRGFRR